MDQEALAGRSNASTTLQGDNGGSSESGETIHGRTGNDSEEQGSQPGTPQSLADKKKGGWPKGRKRKAPESARDSNAPRAPLNGYVRFLQDNREKVRNEYPDIPYSEVTRILGTRWSQLAVEQKQKYLDDAQRDKERYLKELSEYQQTDAYKSFVKRNKEQEGSVLGTIRTRGQSAIDSSSKASGKPQSTSIQQQVMQELEMNEDEIPGCSVPIFTEEFLEHNKTKESELRELRKSNTELEEQNSILKKHISNMKAAIDRLEKETTEQQSHNTALEQQLTSLRQVLVSAFAKVQLPQSRKTPNMETIDSYMSDMHNTLVEKPDENDGLLRLVRDTVSKIDYHK
ncbi:high mobility group protein 20A-like [Corticium candelabrum]|uniref:high mobility group protein 20A-like n=1 Tax=Corticium candelabrum TaxID=121492 RepID=UPI002E26B427|nr:high mobility group protein 20A-like [Corticium candelabrum]